MKKIFSWFLILQSLSLFTVGLYLVYLSEAPSYLSFNNYAYSRTVSPKGAVPVRITISDLGIDLPVFKATMNDNIWPTTDLGASYLTSSPLPGTKGNSIIYAHNWISLFGHLQNAKVGQSVVITYPDHTKKTFIIAYTSVVSPDEATILAPTSDKRITLYTCTGLFDSKRFVAVAILKS